VDAMNKAFAYVVILWGTLTTARALQAQTYLSADGQTDTYSLITSKLAPGANPIEVPDCGDPANAPHIRQAWNEELSQYVFQFFIHVLQDDDPSTNPCNHGDRQRNEIKTYASSPEYLKAYAGDAVTYRWKFKLDTGFQPSPNFTHVHQIKPVDGNDAYPVITYIPVSGSTDLMQLRYYDDWYTLVKLSEVPLAPFRGEWVEANEQITFGVHGSYSMSLTRVRDAVVLMSYSNSDINLLRSGASFYRPKWGIYRSLLKPQYLRDEIVLFDNFCLAKGVDRCLPPDFDISLAPASQSVTAGNTTAFMANISAKYGFNSRISLKLSGAPAGTTVSFDQNAPIGSGSVQISISTTNSVLPGKYTLHLTGTAGIQTHSSDIVLDVTPAPDFQLSITPTSQKVIAGDTTSFTTSVEPENGFNNPVSFGVSGYPTNTTATFDNDSVTGSGSAQLRIATAKSAVPGTYPLTVLASSGVLSHTAAASLVIAGQPDFNLSLSPTTQTVKMGQSATYLVTVSPKNDLNQAVSFSCSGLPKTAACAFSPPVVNVNGAGVNSNLTISTSSLLATIDPAPRMWRLGALTTSMLLFLPMAGGRRARAKVMLALLVVLAAASVACGGQGATHSPDQGTPTVSGNPISYEITVIAASGDLQHSAVAKLTVSP
jgi:hypothetical protein